MRDMAAALTACRATGHLDHLGELARTLLGAAARLPGAALRAASNCRW